MAKPVLVTPRPAGTTGGAAGLGSPGARPGRSSRSGAGNGDQKRPEAVDGILGTVGGAYRFQTGKFHNLNADASITGHSDIPKNEVAYALLTAVATT